MSAASRSAAATNGHSSAERVRHHTHSLDGAMSHSETLRSSPKSQGTAPLLRICLTPRRHPLVPYSVLATLMKLTKETRGRGKVGRRREDGGWRACECVRPKLSSRQIAQPIDRRTFRVGAASPEALRKRTILGTNQRGQNRYTYRKRKTNIARTKVPTRRSRGV